MMWRFALLLLFLVTASSEIANLNIDPLKPNVTIGGLFPFTNHNAGRERGAFGMLAVAVINADPMILPGVNLILENEDTLKTPTGGVRGAIKLLGRSIGLVGAASSGVSQAIASVSSVYKTFQISYSSTSPTLSNKVLYPFFLRTVPPDSVQGEVWLSIMQNFKWTSAALISSDDSYGNGGASIFMKLAEKANVQVVTWQKMPPFELDFSSQVSAIKNSGARIIVINALVTDVKILLLNLYDAGLYGLEYQYIVSDGGTQISVVRNDANDKFDDIRMQVFRGMLGILPLAGEDGVVNGEKTKLAKILDVWETLNPVLYPVASMDQNRRQYNSYSPFVVDAIFSYAHCLHNMIEDGIYTNENINYAMNDFENTWEIWRDYLYNTSFIGVTGLVAFNEDGDRLGEYAIMNLQTDPISLVVVGRYDSLNGVTVSGVKFWDGTDNAISGNLPEVNISSPGLAVHYIIIIVIVSMGVVGVVSFKVIRNKNRLLRLKLLEGRKVMKYNEIKFDEMIGEGSWGQVYRATFRGTVVAVKKINLSNISEILKASMETSGEGNQNETTKNSMNISVASWSKNIDETIMGSTKGYVSSKSFLPFKSSKSSIDIVMESVIDQMMNEIDMLVTLRHPNIVLFMGSIAPPNLCIITEYMAKGSLDDVLLQSRKGVIQISWYQRMKFALDSTRGISFLHSNEPPILHCDLKSANLLLNNAWDIKVADFGFTQLKGSRGLVSGDMRGTLPWIAPEILEGHTYTEKADIYSLSIIFSEIVNEELPYSYLMDGGDILDVPIDTFEQVFAVAVSDGLRPERRNPCPADFWLLCNDCWISDIEQRPNADVILNRLERILADPAFIRDADRMIELVEDTALSFVNYKGTIRASGNFGDVGKSDSNYIYCVELTSKEIALSFKKSRENFCIPFSDIVACGRCALSNANRNAQLYVGCIITSNDVPKIDNSVLYDSMLTRLFSNHIQCRIMYIWTPIKKDLSTWIDHINNAVVSKNK